MKTLKPFLASLAAVFLIANSAYADPLNKQDILANNIPISIEFMLGQKGGNTAEIFFRKTFVPAHISCYFAPANNQQYKGIVAHFASDNAKITFQPGADPTLAGGGNEMKMLAIESITNNGNIGSITITLDGTINVKTATIMCSMQKINTR